MAAAGLDLGLVDRLIPDRLEAEVRRVRFADAVLEREFRADYVRRRLAQFRLFFWLGLLIQLPVVARSLVIDEAGGPSEARFWIRLAVGIVPAVIGLRLLGGAGSPARPASPRILRRIEAYVIVYVLLLGATIVVVFASLESGWAHLMTFMAAALILPRLRVRTAAAVAIPLLGWYAIYSGVAADHPDSLREGLTNLGFMAFWLLVGLYFIEYSARRDFLLLRLLAKERFLAVVDTERRRIERDLHDGAQQRLATTSLWLDVLETNLGDEAGERTREAVARMAESLSGATAELRELTRAGAPAILVEHGLDAALAALAGRAPGTVAVHGRAGDDVPPRTAAAAYFAAAEGITNAVRHSGSRAIDLTVTREEALLRVEVRDEGVGGARMDAGSGLRGLRDRVGEHGGRLTLESRAGAGTLLRIEFPDLGAARASRA